MERVGDRWGKMERCCLTGQSPQRAVAPTEEEEEEITTPRAALPREDPGTHFTFRRVDFGVNLDG